MVTFFLPVSCGPNVFKNASTPSLLSSEIRYIDVPLNWLYSLLMVVMACRQCSQVTSKKQKNSSFLAARSLLVNFAPPSVENWKAGTVSAGFWAATESETDKRKQIDNSL